MLNIHHIERSNYVNGTGNRYVIWVQGCDLGCVECWNKQTWSFKKHTHMQVGNIFKDICSQKNLDGVTFSGGEPFLQAEKLSELAGLIKRHTHLDIHIFTGFELHEMQSLAQASLMKLADTLVYGRFDSQKENNNQKVHIDPLTKSTWAFNNTDIEVDIDNNGDLKITGYPNQKFIHNCKGV